MCQMISSDDDMPVGFRVEQAGDKPLFRIVALYADGTAQPVAYATTLAVATALITDCDPEEE